MEYRDFLVKFGSENIDIKKNNLVFIQRLCDYDEHEVSSSHYEPILPGIWSDRLVSVGNKKIAYDTNFPGNPRHYGTFDSQGQFVAGITYTWEGSDLVGYHNSETNKTVSYTYNGGHIRVNKTVNGVQIAYFYDGDRLIMEKAPGYTMRFIYDEVGLLLGMTYQTGTTVARYYYIRDHLMNIVGLADGTGVLVVRYYYDAWGNEVYRTGAEANTVGEYNPFRYKGYYYDKETGLYYLRSRYYDPNIGRYLSTNNKWFLSTGDFNKYNLFTYGRNDPVTTFAGAERIASTRGSGRSISDISLINSQEYSNDCTHNIANEINAIWDFFFNSNFKFFSV